MQTLFLHSYSPCVQSRVATSACTLKSQTPYCLDTLTPSLPQPVKMFGLKSTPYTTENSIFDGPITNLLSVLCILIEVLSHADAKGAQRLNNFEFGTFIGHFPSDHVASLAVKRLNCKCMCQSLTSTFKELCGCTVLSMPESGENNRADTAVGRATTTNRLCLIRSEVLRSLRHYLQAQIQGHLTTISMRREVEEEDLLYDLPFQRQDRAIVSLTNIGTFYKATVEKHWWDRVEHIILWAFPSI